MLSDRLNPKKELAINLVTTLAAAMGSPINGVRNRQFFNFNEGAVPARTIIDELHSKMRIQKSLGSKVNYVICNRFNIAGVHLDWV